MQYLKALLGLPDAAALGALHILLMQQLAPCPTVFLVLGRHAEGSAGICGASKERSQTASITGDLLPTGIAEPVLEAGSLPGQMGVPLA